MFFDALCGTFKIKDLPREFVLLKLFKFSLEVMEEEWYSRLQYCNITRWKMCAHKFIAKIFPCSKIEGLPKDFTFFVQEIGESLYAAWGRYSKLLNFYLTMVC